MRKGPLNPKYIKSRGQNRSYNQGSYQNRPNSRNRGQDPSSRPDKTIETVIFKETLEGMEDKIIGEDI